YDQTVNTVLKQFMEATWNFVANITKPNQEEMFMKYFGSRAHLLNIPQSQDPTVKCMLSKLQVIGKVALPYHKLWKCNKLLAYMETTYNLAQVCLDERPCMTLEPSDYFEEVMATFRDHKELLWVWEGWRDSGSPLHPIFGHYVQLSNKAAQLNGEQSGHKHCTTKYESDTVEQDLEQIYQELQPLCFNLHVYVRHALHHHYGPELITLQGPIPAHLLGKGLLSWNSILDMVLPFPKKHPIDITYMIKSQHWKPEKMFEEADKFFTSLGLLSVSPDFWKKSMLERLADGRVVECQTSAWDFYTGNDFRVKKCTEVTIEDLLSVSHQMGHIQYFMQYQNLFVIFCEGASPAFEEVVGAMVTHSASSHRHLFITGLINLWLQDSEEEGNYLMGMALEKIAFIPFSYLMDLIRWKVFDGTIEKNFYKQEWWNSGKYQGLCPSVPWTEDDFDPGAKFHVSANVPYTQYFLSTVLQFQLHETLCNALGYVGPLHQCDIYSSKIAGRILGHALKLSSSKPWPEVLKELTGQSNISTRALMTYFKSLLNWLVADNVQQSEILGCPDYTCFFSG
uniref:Angiotensin-converting enzyme n=1 Tax=Cavia porcellus TaxID=10141 RepID=H0WA57_CAVPO